MLPAMHRRRFLQLAGLGAAHLLALRARAGEHPRYGPLLPDPAGILDLPAGFRYARLQRAGERMSDGHRVPGRPDGMCCHARGDRWVLLRNHELSDRSWVKSEAIPRDRIPAWRRTPGVVDGSRFGGVTRVELDPQAVHRVLAGESARPVLNTRTVLAGTDLNCAGGKVPGGWVSCEESEAQGHGWAWFVPVEAQSPADARRLDGWGRFCHEAIALAPDGTVYLTEDHRDGLFYRFLPANPADPLGPGRLQALALKDVLTHADHQEVVRTGQSWPAGWVDIPDPAATEQRCLDQGRARGATAFHRGEGVATDGKTVWWVASTAGPAGAGQLWALDLASDTVRLEYQVTDRTVLSMPDNLVITPWGDLLLCEDNYNQRDGATHQYLRVYGLDGRIYDLARNARANPGDANQAPGDEFSGACFSPDGRVLFVNLMGDADETLAITGPW